MSNPGFLLSATFADREGEAGCASRTIDTPTMSEAIAKMSALLTRAGATKIDMICYAKRNP